MPDEKSNPAESSVSLKTSVPDERTLHDSFKLVWIRKFEPVDCDWVKKGGSFAERAVRTMVALGVMS